MKAKRRKRNKPRIIPRKKDAMLADNFQLQECAYFVYVCSPYINRLGLNHTQQTVTQKVIIRGCQLRMGDHRLPKRVMSGEFENAGKRGPGGKEKEWTDCVADDLRLFGVTGDWKTAALDPGAWYNTVQEGGCRFMAAWVREEENASNQRQKKRDAEEADKVEVAPGVTVASLRRFRTALIGPTQGLPKRRRLCH